MKGKGTGIKRGKSGRDLCGKAMGNGSKTCTLKKSVRTDEYEQANTTSEPGFECTQWQSGPLLCVRLKALPPSSEGIPPKTPMRLYRLPQFPERLLCCAANTTRGLATRETNQFIPAQAFVSNSPCLRTHLMSPK